MTLYEVLGVPADATDMHISSAYRKLAKMHHPDKGGNVENFRKITHAFEVLRDPARRQRYDETGDESGMTNEEAQERAQILSVVQTIISAIVLQSQDDPAHTDFRERIIRQMGAKEAKMKMDRLKAEQEIKKTQRFLNRFKRDEGEDIIGSVIQQSIRQLEDQVRNIDTALELHKKVVAFFITYRYETDPPENEGHQNPGEPTRQSRYLFGGTSQG